jgi:hypothetical protein
MLELMYMTSTYITVESREYSKNMVKHAYCYEKLLISAQSLARLSR